MFFSIARGFDSVLATTHNDLGSILFDEGDPFVLMLF